MLAQHDLVFKRQNFDICILSFVVQFYGFIPTLNLSCFHSNELSQITFPRTNICFLTNLYLMAVIAAEGKR